MSAPEKNTAPPIQANFQGGSMDGQIHTVDIEKHYHEDRKTGEVYYRYTTWTKEGGLVSTFILQPHLSAIKP